jgi:hypothetical protein
VLDVITFAAYALIIVDERDEEGSGEGEEAGAKGSDRVLLPV